MRETPQSWLGKPTIRNRRDGISVRDITEHETRPFDPVQWMRDFAQVVNVTGGTIRNIDDKGQAFIKALYGVSEVLEQRELPIPTEWTRLPESGELQKNAYQIGSNLGFYDRFRPSDDLRTQPLTGDELALELALKIGRTHREAAENVLRGWTHASHLGVNQRAESMGGYKGHSSFVNAKSDFLIMQLKERL